MHNDDAVSTPVTLFHWDVYSMDDNDAEFPVYLEDVSGFGQNLFVQIETTAPPPRKRSKKRSQKDRRTSRQYEVSDRSVCLAGASTLSASAASFRLMNAVVEFASLGRVVEKRLYH